MSIHKSSTFEVARSRGEPYIYQHTFTGVVLDRSALRSILGGKYRDGTTVRASHFRVIDTTGENPFQ